MLHAHVLIGGRLSSVCCYSYTVQSLVVVTEMSKPSYIIAVEKGKVIYLAVMADMVGD